ncbi:MAG: hypothetical protein NZ927_01470 [Candidatus Calescibacterium sp.]|nr:hypothetical protein [Candidatus Calescibacterium sp.]MCX7733620.1 hypothetical protein [bacterium]MDW8087195.1 hypothetical protein [Candidatus Calescibacterium sp.]
MNQLISLLILGVATIIYIVKKILSLVFFPIYLIIKYQKNRFKKNYIKKYASKGLVIIDFEEFMKQRSNL